VNHTASTTTSRIKSDVFILCHSFDDAVNRGVINQVNPVDHLLLSFVALILARFLVNLESISIHVALRTGVAACYECNPKPIQIYPFEFLRPLHRSMQFRDIALLIQGAIYTTGRGASL